MEKDKLLEIYEAGAKIVGFTANDQEPWLVQVSPGNYGGFKQNGFYLGGPYLEEPATFELTPTVDIPSDFDWQEEITDQYRGLAKGQAVRIPRVLRRVVKRLHLVTVWERPVGQRIISDEEFQGPFRRSDGFYQKIQETAQVHWATAKTLDYLTNRDDRIKRMITGASAVDYFTNDRFPKWDRIRAKEANGLDHLVPRTQKAEILIAILGRNAKEQRPMEMSFNLFGNTDIVKVSGSSPFGGGYYLVNGRFEIKPSGFAPAAWIWNLMLYSGHKKGESQVLKEVLMAIEVFDKAIGKKGYAYDIATNLLERIYAGLEIDLSLKRSPFDKGNAGTEYYQTIRNFQYVLDQTLKFVSP